MNKLAKGLLVEKSKDIGCRCFFNRIYLKSAILLPSQFGCLLPNRDRRLHLFAYKMVSLARIVLRKEEKETNFYKNQ